MKETQGSGILPQHPNSEIESILYPILTTGQITRSDQQKLLSFMFSNPELKPEDRKKINRVFDDIRKGGYTVID
ncbi:MAG: hypothetical protein VKK42_21745 [Lyngbya sp.]|nr:hypothetical protein [Lyngbya sp.]